MSFQIEKGDGTVAARGASVMVAFDNATDSSILIPVDWREKITKFDKLEK
jgi:acyl-CoA thioesterase FadM